MDSSIKGLRLEHLDEQLSAPAEILLENHLDRDAINLALGISNDLEPILFRVRIVAMAGTQTPVSRMIVGDNHCHGGGRTNLLCHLIPDTQLKHESLGLGVIVYTDSLRFGKLAEALLHDGYSLAVSVMDSAEVQMWHTSKRHSESV